MRLNMVKQIDKYRALLSGPQAKAGVQMASKALHEGPRILAILPNDSDRLTLEELAREAGWAFAAMDTFSESLVQKRRQLPPIVIYDSRIRDRDWNRRIRDIANSPSHPCVILLCASCDRNLLDELERAGGCDVMHTPVDASEARLKISRAWQLWRGLQQVRFPLQIVRQPN